MEVSHMIALLIVASSLLFPGSGGSPSPQRPASISGVLTDTTGRGLPGARITIRSDDGERHATVTDSTGRYHVSELGSGRYTVEASMAGFDARSTGVVVPTGADAVWNGVLLVASPFGERSIERQVAQVTGSDALDCGRYSGPASDSALQRSLVCALTSAEAGRSFSVIVQFAAGPTVGGEGLLAAEDGVIHLLQYGQDAMSFRIKPCASPHVTKSHFTCLR
jgi:hypothetical protein